MISAGKLRHFGVIEQRGVSLDSFGQPVDSWSAVASCYMAIIPLKGRELFAAQAVQSETTVRIELRYVAGVLQKMRVNALGKIYNILSVINIDERNRELHLLCGEGLNQG